MRIASWPVAIGCTPQQSCRKTSLPFRECSNKLLDFSDSLQQVGHEGGPGCQAAVGQHQTLQLCCTAHQCFTVVGIVICLLPKPAAAAKDGSEVDGTLA